MVIPQIKEDSNELQSKTYGCIIIVIITIHVKVIPHLKQLPLFTQKKRKKRNNFPFVLHYYIKYSCQRNHHTTRNGCCCYHVKCIRITCQLNRTLIYLVQLLLKINEHRSMSRTLSTSIFSLSQLLLKVGCYFNIIALSFSFFKYVG